MSLLQFPVLSWWQVANEWQQGGFKCAPLSPAVTSKFQILGYTLFLVTHHCKRIPIIPSSAHNFQPISGQHCQRHRGTSDENKQTEWGKDTNSYFLCAFRVYGESYVCTAVVRCGRWDLGMTSVQFPSYYRASQVGATREELPECMEIFHTLGELSPSVSPSGHVCCGVKIKINK